MKTEEEYAADPWYKQPWLLLAMIPLVATVIAGSTFLVVSIISSDGIVKDDYYRMARGYYKDPTKEQLAFDKNIAADIAIDNVTGDLSVQLTGNFSKYPSQLKIDFVSPTHQKYDLTINLKQVADQPFYLGSLASPLTGKRYVMLTPIDKSWRLGSTISPPYAQLKVTLAAEKPQ
ncbi:MAG: FixH family protein [Oceanospirillaceae bacterium]